jgi:hypothetical protein
MVRKYRLLRRRDDGSADYSPYSDEGSELLTVYPDGRKFRHVIQGINLAKARALGTAPAPIQIAAPVVDLKIDDPVQDIPAPEVRPTQTVTSGPAPEPVNEKLDRDAKMLGKSVWLSGGGRKHTLLQGIPQSRQEELLGYATEAGWIAVSKDGVVTPGPVRPVDLMPVTEPLSARERRIRWGPGDPLW